MKRILSCLFATALLFSGNVFAQQKPLHEIYSMMMYNFVKYVQWPEDGSGDFIIGVAGNDEIFKTMNTWYNGSKISGRTCVIKKIESVTDSENCHVVYIDKVKSSDFDAISSKVKGKSTLLITDKNGLGQKGSGINFKVVDNKLKFELNQKAIESANLRVSSTLSSMAILI